MPNQDKMDVNVTEDRIRRGARRSRLHCPIAYAIFEDNGNIIDVSVGGSFALIRTTDRRVFRRKLPAIAQRFIRHFDEGGKPLPLQFQINALPEEYR